MRDWMIDHFFISGVVLVAVLIQVAILLSEYA